MATKASPQMNGERDQSKTCQNGVDSLTHFLSLLRPFCEGENGKDLTTIIETNKKLEDENSALRITQKTNLNLMRDEEAKLKRRQTSLEESLKEKEELVTGAVEQAKSAKSKLADEQKTTEDLRAQIQQNEKKIQGLMNAIKKLEVTHSADVAKKEELQSKVQKMGEKEKALLDRLKKQSDEHGETVHDLEDTKASLGAVRRFLVPLQGLDEPRKSTIRNCFQELFHDAMGLFQSTLYHDINDENFAGGVLTGDNLKTLALPLRPTNSSVAKQMRVLAGLMACGKALEKHLFRDSFLTKDPELNEALRVLATEDLCHHAYIRAALAKVLPRTQEQCRVDSIESAINDIMNTIGKLSLNQQILKSGLRPICEKAMTFWTLVQQAEDRIWTAFDVEMPDDWEPIPLQVVETPTSATSAPRNATGPAPANARNGGKNQEPPTLRESDIARVVWPTLLTAEIEEPDNTTEAEAECLHHGYVLTQTQFQEAEEETSNRVARRTRRADLGSQRKRRDSGAFLSSGGALGGGPSSK